MRIFAIVLMTIGSVIISFNGLVLRSINIADSWTIIFYRAFAFTLAIFLFLLFKYRKNVFSLIIKTGPSGFFAGLVLGASNICFIMSMTHTTVANAVFTISLIPFITAILAVFILKEKLAKITLYTMITAFLGVLIMFYGATQTGKILGNLFALVTAFCFSIFAITLRLNKNVDMLPSLLLSGVMAMSISFSVKLGSLQISVSDVALCFLLGGLMSGFVNCCFVFATRHIVAAEVTLFFFIEIALGPIWVWLFANETMSKNTFIGGCLILTSLLVRAVYERFFVQSHTKSFRSG